jgi:acetoin utilization deacetylase AcuC-like enzyme
MDYHHKIKTFYNPLQAVTSKVGFSRSPEKPALLLQFLKDKNIFHDCFEIEPGFDPFQKEDFLIAHTQEYIDAFFAGEKPLASSNGLQWSSELLRSVTYTNSSLYHAIKHSVENPSQICFSPTSGFHHARPGSGSGFCTFSGQVIASVKLFRELGKRGAYMDLDGHFGNSIEDSRDVVAFLNDAVPEGFNFNPLSSGSAYIKDFERCLDRLDQAVNKKQIDYVVWCHGADSHEWDDLGSQCNTEEWFLCSKLFFEWAKQLKLPHPLGIIITLFGGYRSGDDYNSVLSLHTGDLVICLNTLCNHDISYVPEVKPKIIEFKNELHVEVDPQTRLDL